MKLSNKKISRKNKAYAAILKSMYGKDIYIKLFSFEICEMLESKYWHEVCSVTIGYVSNQIERRI